MTVSIRRTSRAADSPGRYFDRVSLDPYYMHRHRTGRSTSTWVPAGPLLQQRRGAIISAPSNFPSSRLAGNSCACTTTRSRPIRKSNLPPFNPFRWPGTERRPIRITSVPLDPRNSTCRRLATAPSIFPSGDFAGTPFPPFNPFRWNRTAPVDDQLPPRRSPQRRFIVLPVLRQFFHNFFCYHIGITFRSRSLVVFFQLRSVSCAPFTPTFADGVVQRSLALYLPCFVSLCSPVWPRAISHRSSSIFHREPTIHCSLLR